MATAVVSDLHLGTRTGTDLLRRPEIRRKLVDALAGSDRVVLLGDVVELRDRPLGEALKLARPFFDELAEALDGAEVVLAAGNHDHPLAGSLLQELRIRGAALPLDASAPAAGLASPLARWLGPSPLTLAYPGIWLRPDVYATHGHYLDCHTTVPLLERLAIGASQRIVGALPEGPRTPQDYELVLAPIYGLAVEWAQSERRRAVNARPSARIWGRLNRPDRTGAEKLFATAAVRGVTRALNATGLGPLGHDLSGPALRDASIQAMRAALTALGVEAAHVVFGHSHRRGPLPGEPHFDGPGSSLVNTGSWIFEPALTRGSGPSDPYWPGGLVTVGDSGPPELHNLLADATPQELAA